MATRTRIACLALLTALAVSATAQAKPFAGTSIKIIAEMCNPTRAIEAQLPAFEAMTGIKVQLEYGPMDAVVQKELLSMQSGTGEYDVISAPFQFIGSYVENGYVSSIDGLMRDGSLKLAGFDAANMVPGMWEKAAKWKDHYYGVPSNTCIQILAYRKDLFENPQEKKAFKAKYGYELKTPTDWKTYRDAAAFFTRKKGGTLAGEKLDRDFYGVTFCGKRHDAAVCDWQSFSWSFGGGTFGDKGDLVINNDKNVRALEYILSLRQYAPPGISNNTWDEQTTQLQQGLVAMTIIFNDCAPSIEDATNSKSAGKMGYAIVPVEERSIGGNYGAWTFFIPKSSKKQEAAWQFLQWVSTSEVQREIVIKGGGFPTLKSLYEDKDLSAQLPYWKGSYEAYKICSAKPRIPEWNEINNIIMLHLSRAYNDEVSPKKALDAAAKEIARIMKGKLPISYR
jgi:multiple sugar transport system substrate-binding protein